MVVVLGGSLLTSGIASLTARAAGGVLFHGFSVATRVAT